MHARYHVKAQDTPLAPLYALPITDDRQSFLKTKFLVVDCEMSGLDVNKDRLLSIGWVIIENGRIQTDSAEHFIIHSSENVGESVLIHGLHDHMLAQGQSMQDVLSILVQRIQACVLVFHHAPIDLRFLQKSAMGEFHCPFLFSYIDTMEIQEKRLNQSGKHSGLRLQQCRSGYGLPDYPQHNALNDAQATAELFLAQAHHIGVLNALCLNDFPIRCS